MGGESDSMTRAKITAFALLLAAAGAGCTIYPAEPASPTYAKDVRPILAAHCTRCHGGMIGPGANGSVTVSFPGAHTFTPGVKQHLVVTIADSAARRWGFQMTARLASGTSTQAGNFTAGADGFTQLVCTQTNFRSQTFGNACATNGMPLQYIEHSAAGSRLGTTGGVIYEFDWIPPDSTGNNVILYVAAMGANGDNSDRGDRTYTARYTGNGADDIVFSVELVNVRSLAHSLLRRDEDAIGSGDQARQFGIQFDNAYRPRPVYRVDLAILVEQDGEIVEPGLDAIVLPGTPRVRGAEHLQPEAIHIGEDVVDSLVIPKARSPNPLAVDLLSILEPERGTEV